MKIMLRELRAHQKEAWLLLGGIVLLWIFTIATWMYDDSGISQGMHPAALVIQLIIPIFIGVLAVRWCDSWTDRIHCGIWLVIMYAVLELLFTFGWDRILFLMGTTEPTGGESYGFWANLLFVLGMGLLFIAIGVALAGMGAWLAWLITAVRNRLAPRKLD